MNKYLRDIPCFAALFLSIAAFVVSLLRNYTYDVDYPSLLVSVLSFLVTVLIGWNIYSLVDFNKRQKDIDTKISLVNEQIKTSQSLQQLNKGLVEQAISDLYYVQLGVGHPTPMVYFYLNHLICAIIAFTNIGDYETPRVLIKGVVEVLPHPELTKLNKAERAGLLGSISLVKNPNKIPNWTDLVDIVARMDKR